MTEREQKILDEIKQLENEIAQETNKEINIMKQKGYNFLYTYDIHPLHGDDFICTFYSKNEVSKEELTQKQKQLKNKYKAILVNIITEKI